MIPDMITGIRHWVGLGWLVGEGGGRGMGWWERTFMIRSGRKVPTPAMPMPDFAVPYAAPAPVVGRGVSYCLVEVGGSREEWGEVRRTAEDHG